jgi:hypothetical protein
MGEDIPGQLIHSLSITDNTKADLLHHSALEWLNMDMADFR